MRLARSASDVQVSQHETGATRAADAVTEVVGGSARVGADPHLVEYTAAAAAHHRAQQAWILIADHGAQPLHRACVHGQRLVAVKPAASWTPHSPRRAELHMLFQSVTKGLGARLSNAISSRQLVAGARSGILPFLPAVAQSSTVVPVMAAT